MDKITKKEQLVLWMETYQNLVFTLCYRLTNDQTAAEDLTQETFLSAYLKMDQFDGTYEKAWICKIASNKCMDYLKSPGRQIEYCDIQEKMMKNPKVFEQSPEEIFIQEDIKNQVFHLCEKLKEPYKDVAKLYFYDEKTVEEIAGLQEKKIKTIQTQIYRAKAMLAKHWKKEEGVKWMKE